MRRQLLVSCLSLFACSSPSEAPPQAATAEKKAPDTSMVIAGAPERRASAGAPGRVGTSSSGGAGAAANAVGAGRGGAAAAAGSSAAGSSAGATAAGAGAAPTAGAGAGAAGMNAGGTVAAAGSGGSTAGSAAGSGGRAGSAAGSGGSTAGGTGLQPVYRVPLRVHMQASRLTDAELGPILAELNTIWLGQAGICFEIEVTNSEENRRDGFDFRYTSGEIPGASGANGVTQSAHSIWSIDHPRLNNAPHPVMHPTARTSSVTRSASPTKTRRRAATAHRPVTASSKATIATTS